MATYFRWLLPCLCLLVCSWLGSAGAASSVGTLWFILPTSVNPVAFVTDAGTTAGVGTRLRIDQLNFATMNLTVVIDESTDTTAVTPEEGARRLLIAMMDSTSALATTYHITNYYIGVSLSTTTAAASSETGELSSTPLIWVLVTSLTSFSPTQFATDMAGAGGLEATRVTVSGMTFVTSGMNVTFTYLLRTADTQVTARSAAVALLTALQDTASTAYTTYLDKYKISSYYVGVSTSVVTTPPPVTEAPESVSPPKIWVYFTNTAVFSPVTFLADMAAVGNVTTSRVTISDMAYALTGVNISFTYSLVTSSTSTERKARVAAAALKSALDSGSASVPYETYLAKYNITKYGVTIYASTRRHTRSPSITESLTVPFEIEEVPRIWLLLGSGVTFSTSVFSADVGAVGGVPASRVSITGLSINGGTNVSFVYTPRSAVTANISSYVAAISLLQALEGMNTSAAYKKYLYKYNIAKYNIGVAIPTGSQPAAYTPHIVLQISNVTAFDLAVFTNDIAAAVVCRVSRISVEGLVVGPSYLNITFLFTARSNLDVLVGDSYTSIHLSIALRAVLLSGNTSVAYRQNINKYGIMSWSVEEPSEITTTMLLTAVTRTPAPNRTSAPVITTNSSIVMEGDSSSSVGLYAIIFGVIGVILVASGVTMGIKWWSKKKERELKPGRKYGRHM